MGGKTMKKRKLLLAALFTCAILSSCTPLQSRKYEAYGTYLTANQVEKVCKDAGGKYARYYHIYHYFGVFNEKVHIMAMKLDIPGFAATQALEDFYVANTYVCSLPDGSYSLIAWIEGEGAWSLKKAYEDGKVSKDDIKNAALTADGTSLRKYGHLAVPLEEFTFSLTWGVGFDSSYDSDSGTLVKTNKVIERSPEEYVTTFEYPSLESLYEKAKHLSLYYYPSDYDAYDGVLISTSPMTNYRLTIDDKTIEARNCPIIDGYPEGLSWRAKEFLEIVFEIRDTILNSEEWKALPDYEVLYR